MSAGSVQEFDVCVIGGGSGGIGFARRAASHGASVCVIEKNHLGGTCVNVGCVPKKVMWYASNVRQGLTFGKHYGMKSPKGGCGPCGSAAKAAAAKKECDSLTGNYCVAKERQEGKVNVHCDAPPFDWPSFVMKRNAYVERLRGIYARNLAKSDITCFRGVGGFASKDTVEVDLLKKFL